MATYHRSPGFFFARGFLGVCGVGGVLVVAWGLVDAFTNDDLHREIRGRPRDAVVEDPSVWLSLLDAAPVVIQGLVMAVAAWLVFIVVIDIQRGVPFDDQAARRLRASAVIITGGIFVLAAVSAWADLAVLDAAGARHRNGFDTYFIDQMLGATVWFLVAALLAVFAHAFREGQRLRHDSEGLV